MYPANSDNFWNETPRTYLIKMEAARKRLIRERENNITDCWLIANFQRAEKLPELDKYLDAVLPGRNDDQKSISEEIENAIVIARIKDAGLQLKRLEAFEKSSPA